jgi:hypothetical protein
MQAFFLFALFAVLVIAVPGQVDERRHGQDGRRNKHKHRPEKPNELTSIDQLTPFPDFDENRVKIK